MDHILSHAQASYYFAVGPKKSGASEVYASNRPHAGPDRMNKGLDRFICSEMSSYTPTCPHRRRGMGKRPGDAKTCTQPRLHGSTRVCGCGAERIAHCS